MAQPDKHRAPRNHTITLSEGDSQVYLQRLKKLTGPVTVAEVMDATICQDVFEILDWLPDNSVDLLFADPPYNLTKSFNSNSFSQVSLVEYEEWLEMWLSKATRLLKATASIYICGDWRSSAAVHRIAEKYFVVRNRITWEREKGRGAKANWKNCSEDIWFCTMSEQYIFHVEDVKLKRLIIAPYTNEEGEPKDWIDAQEGRFRLTHPSNIWTDLTVPFWSMPENTDHPTQKPEKLLAKIMLASSNPGDVVFDPFLGSGTTSVAARKLGRRFIGVEIDEDYCCLAEKRLDMAIQDTSIQGYSDGVFWERNTLADQKKGKKTNLHTVSLQPTLFTEQGEAQ